MLVYCYLLLTALIAALLMLPFLRTWAATCGAMDKPGERKVHTEATPRIGGIALFLSILFALFVFVDLGRELCGILAGALILFFAGLVDDLYGISTRRKFVGEIVAALTTMGVGGLYISRLGDLFGLGAIDLPLWLALPFTVFAVVGVINAVNLIDGLDGLAGGVALVAFGGFFLLGYIDGNPLVMTLSAAAAGAILGFLRFNVHPASIFMGDSGSLVLGFLLACTAIALTQGDGAGIAAAVPVLLLGLPIADTLFVMGRRVLCGGSPFAADLGHVHHKLLHLGFAQRAVVLSLCGSAGLLTLFAIACRHWPAARLLAVFVLAAAAGYLGLFLLQRYRRLACRPARLDEFVERPAFDSPPLPMDAGARKNTAA